MVLSAKGVTTADTVIDYGPESKWTIRNGFKDKKLEEEFQVYHRRAVERNLLYGQLICINNRMSTVFLTILGIFPSHYLWSSIISQGGLAAISLMLLAYTMKNAKKVQQMLVTEYQQWWACLVGVVLVWEIVLFCSLPPYMLSHEERQQEDKAIVYGIHSGFLTMFVLAFLASMLGLLVRTFVLCWIIGVSLWAYFFITLDVFKSRMVTIQPIICAFLSFLLSVSICWVLENKNRNGFLLRRLLLLQKDRLQQEVKNVTEKMEVYVKPTPEEIAAAELLNVRLCPLQRTAFSFVDRCYLVGSDTACFWFICMPFTLCCSLPSILTLAVLPLLFGVVV